MKKVYFALAVAPLVSVLSADLGRCVFAQAPNDSSIAVKISQATAAGPPSVAREARIIETDPAGHITTLRAGHNGFTCMPAAGLGTPAMCADAASMQWFADIAAHKPKPTNTVPGITYMLAGATQRSDSDPYDTTSPLIQIGPHWMILWPFDPAATGLPRTHRKAGAYVMWAGTPYAHLHVMGTPQGTGGQTTQNQAHGGVTP